MLESESDAKHSGRKRRKLFRRGFVVTIIWEVLSFSAFVLNLTANSSDHWWVNARDGGERTFLRTGLWQVCFNMYRHRFDYYGKIYHGCWWFFSPEIRLLRSWILTNWLRWVQTFSTLSLVTSFFAFLVAISVLADPQAFKTSKKVLTAAILHATAGILMFITVILFGVYGKRRDWMMNWQFNWFGWSFHVAIVACILHFATAILSAYQALNKILADAFDYEKASEELEERGTLRKSKGSSSPISRTNRSRIVQNQ